MNLDHHQYALSKLLSNPRHVFQIKREVLRIALVVRATLNATGAITFTGNTLGLSRANQEGTPGTNDSIGAFITVNTALRHGSYPPGTTSAYLNNSSSAVLVLPAGSNVLYAELIWGATHIVGNTNLSSVINNAVSFTTPTGSFNVSPDPATSNEFELAAGASGYVRSANVTTLVQQGGAGTYTTGRVAGIIAGSNDLPVNVAGWTLGVIYQNPSLPFRNMSLRVGAVLVQANSTPITTTLSGFATPVSGVLGGRALFSSLEGDAARTGDQALFGATTSSLAALSGPNNLANNFFASQINNDSGNLDTTGTFGTRNQTNGNPGTNISGGRQGWDITNVDISSRLVNNQTSAVLRLTTSGDAYVVNANAIQVDINAPRITVTKSSSSSGAVVGDILTYTVTVSNTGTANAASVVLSDALPAGTSFVTGSVMVGGAARVSADIQAGIPLGSLAVGSSVTVTFRVQVLQGAAAQKLVNQANAAFTFQSLAGGPSITGVIPSNEASVQVYTPIITLRKTASADLATVGETITYTVLVSNTGSVGARVVLTDSIPAGGAYVGGSLQINGAHVSGAEPGNGVQVGTVPAGGFATVIFQVRIESVPTPPQLTNQASATYTYQPPDGRTLSGSAASNAVVTPVALPNITIRKSVNRTIAAVGEELTYSSVITNNGVSAVTDVVFLDSLPNGIRLVPGSLSLNGVSLPSANPDAGVSIGNLDAGSSVTVSFQVLVESVPTSAAAVNESRVSYRSGSFYGQSVSNSVVTSIYQSVIVVTKSTTVANAVVGLPVPFTMVLRNTGSLPAIVVLRDPLPSQTSFVTGSVLVNGSSRPEASPVDGIELGSLAPGAWATVTFQSVLKEHPSPSRLSNQAVAVYSYVLPDGRTMSGASSSNVLEIRASAPVVTITKEVNSTEAAVNDVLRYILRVTNNGSATVTNVIVTDTLSAELSAQRARIAVNGIPVTGATPETGIPIGSVTPGATAEVIYEARVTSLPASGLVVNGAAASYSSGTFHGVSYAAPVTTQVYTPLIQVSKSVNSAAVILGDTIGYTFVISNTGNISADVVFSDILPREAVFEPNSFIINGIPTPGVHPEAGIALTAIPAAGSSIITMVARVTSLPPGGLLTNVGRATYTYTLPSGRQVTGTASSNQVAIPVSFPTVSITLSTDAVSVTGGDTITYTAVITNTGTSASANVFFTDGQPQGTLFVPGSLTVNGAARPFADPAAGIPIGTLAPGASATIQYEVNIIMPTPPDIRNQSTVSFTTGTVSASSSSNVTVTPVTQPVIALLKSADTNNATVGDTVVYSVQVSNSGNLPAEVTVSDTIPAGTSMIDNSVSLNGRPLPGSIPSSGILVGTVSPGQTVTVRFSVVIESLPSPQRLSNAAAAAFTFTTPDGRTESRSASSNTVTFPVSAPNVSVSKATTVTEAVVGDTIPFTVTITNNGVSPINNVVFSDPVPGSTSFVPRSTVVNGTNLPGVSPSEGIPIGSIPQGESVTVAFQVRVDQIPPAGVITNRSSVSFTSGALSASVFSNDVTVPVFQTNLTVTKTADTDNATQGDTVVFRILVTNSGNRAAQVSVTDSIPAGTSFVTNSLLAGGTPLPGVRPDSGFPLGTVEPGETASASFAVVINELPANQLIENSAAARFTFTTPGGRTVGGTAVSNTVTFPVSAPNVSVVKSTTRNVAAVGDTVPYTIVVTNNGNTEVTNLILTDLLPQGTALEPGSVTVQGSTVGLALENGLPLPSLPPGATVTVTFALRVTELTREAVIHNRATVSFSSGAFNALSVSNTTSTDVVQAIVNVNKSANRSVATVGDTLVFRLSVVNSGNTEAIVNLTDTIPEGTSFIPNSVVVNGTPLPGANPEGGIPIGTVDAEITSTASFAVVINRLPDNQLITNQATAAFAFTLPNGRELTGTSVSNALNIPVSAPNVSVVKSTPAIDAVVGDLIRYTVVVTNNGIEPVNSVVLSDPIPFGTEFVAESVTANGSTVPAANPQTGIPLGTIPSGGSVSVDFTVRVTDEQPIPKELGNQASVSFTSGSFSGRSISNRVTTPVYQPNISVVKNANRNNVTVGNNVIYSFLVRNSGNIPAAVILRDAIPANTTFVENSVIIDGSPRPGDNPADGISVGTIAGGDTVEVTLTLQVSVEALPSPQQVINQATAEFTFVPPSGRSISGSVTSNPVAVRVSAPDVTVIKSSSRDNAIVGDTIVYTIRVTNNSNDNVNNVVLTDPVPEGARLVADSVAVNGEPRPGDRPDSGIPLGTIAPAQSVVVTFEVIIE